MSEKIQKIARVCHEANRAYCLSLGDNSQPLWEDAPEWQKESAKNGVQFRIDNPNSLPSDSHNNWLEEKRKEGWVYGEKKDADKKTHPCFVPYNELPIYQQVKDKLFQSIVDILK